MDTYIHDELKHMAMERRKAKDAQDIMVEARKEEDKHFTNIILYVEATDKGDNG